MWTDLKSINRRLKMQLEALAMNHAGKPRSSSSQTSTLDLDTQEYSKKPAEQTEDMRFLVTGTLEFQYILFPEPMAHFIVPHA